MTNSDNVAIEEERKFNIGEQRTGRLLWKQKEKRKGGWQKTKGKSKGVLSVYNNFKSLISGMSSSTRLEHLSWGLPHLGARWLRRGQWKFLEKRKSGFLGRTSKLTMKGKKWGKEKEKSPFVRWEDTFYTQIIITRHLTHSLVLPVPKGSNFRKKKKNVQRIKINK